MTRYEYVAVHVPGHVPKGQRHDDLISSELNKVAAHGWRFVASVSPGTSGVHAIFEREVPEQ